MKRECRCSPITIQRYRSRISGPLLDRIDLHVEVPLVEFRDLSKADGGETSATIRERVETARTIQVARFKGQKNVTSNSAMTPRLMKQHCQITQESQAILERSMDELNFSARAHDRILKVARTLADLDGKESIEEMHLLESINYRTLDRGMLGK